MPFTLLVGNSNATCTCRNADDSTNAAERSLEPAFLSYGLDQCVSSPTHLNADGSLGTLLDLVLASPAHLVRCVDVLPPVGSSDHLPVFCHLSTSSRSTPDGITHQVWRYEKADLEKLNKNLSHADWSPVHSASSVDKAWDAWQQIFLNHAKQSVPSKIVKRVQP